MKSRKAACRSGFASKGSSSFLISVRMPRKGEGGREEGELNNSTETTGHQPS